MSTITETVNLVESKLKILLENYNFLKEENDLLYSKLAVLENQITKEKQLFNELHGGVRASRVWILSKYGLNISANKFLKIFWSRE